MESEGIVAVDSPPPPAIVDVDSASPDDDPTLESPPPSDVEDHRPQATPASPPSLEELRAKIIKQVEYYFSDENLPNDKFLLKHVKKDKEGFVSISLLASFRKMKKLSKDISFIVDALKESSQLAVSLDGKKVKRVHPLPVNEVKDPKSCTVIVENLPEDHSIENIQRICGRVGSIKSVSVHDPHAAEDAVRTKKAEKRISGKIYALIEYETVEAAEKAVATLNDETDWRNGLHVQLLRKRMGYNVGRKAWRGSDSEKGNAKLAVSVGDEENRHSNEQHTDVPDNEDGEHVSKERNGNGNGNGNGRKSRNRSKGRKYRGNSGMGHGSAAVVEASKPPPGPRMPDGTRGFAMGRGRPPVSATV